MIGICDTKSTLGTAESVVCSAKYCFCATKSAPGGMQPAQIEGKTNLSADGADGDWRTTRKYAGNPVRGVVPKTRSG